MIIYEIHLKDRSDSITMDVEKLTVMEYKFFKTKKYKKAGYYFVINKNKRIKEMDTERPLYSYAYTLDHEKIKELKIGLLNQRIEQHDEWLIGYQNKREQFKKMKDGLDEST